MIDDWLSLTKIVVTPNLLILVCLLLALPSPFSTPLSILPRTLV